MQQKQQDKIWDYFQNEGYDYFKNNYHCLKFLSKKCKGTILNIGVGNGALEYLLYKQNKNVFCLDPNNKSIQRVGDIIGKEKCKVGYSTQIPFKDHTFDTIVMSEVLEHLSEDDFKKTLKEVKRILKPGGKFIGIVPANENLNNNQVMCPHCEVVFHRWGHLLSFTCQDMRERLHDEFQDIVISRKLFISWRCLNIKGKISMLIKKSLCFIGVYGSNENIYFKAKK